MAKNGKLTAKEAKFVEEYLVDLNASAAARRAGYSEKTAYRIGFENLRKLHIQNALAVARTKLAKDTETSPEWVVSSLKKVALRCLQEEEVLDREGNSTGEFTFQAAGANKALELIGKTHGIFIDKMVLRKITDPDDLTDEEAIAVAAKLRERFGG